MPSLVDDAVLFAAKAHFGQQRRYSGIPYIAHCMEVMSMVAAVPGRSDAMLAAAALHDTIDAGRTSAQELSILYGRDVASMVLLLSTPSGPDPKAQAQVMLKDLAAAGGEVQTIWLADFISTAPPIIANDPERAVPYLKSGEALLSALTKGDKTLHAKARTILDGGKRKLGLTA